MLQYQDPKRLREERRDMFAVLLALGLDDAAGVAVVFHQDQVPEQIGRASCRERVS